MKTLNRLSLKSILFISVVSIITGCTFVTNRVKQEIDKNEAERVTNKFYAMVKAKKYDDMYYLFSFKFWAVTSVKKMNNIYTTTQDKLGGIVDRKLVGWQSTIVSESDQSAEYELTYHNHREKFDSKETFVLAKDTDNVIRILAYQIDSKGFLK